MAVGAGFELLGPSRDGCSPIAERIMGDVGYQGPNESCARLLDPARWAAIRYAGEQGEASDVTASDRAGAALGGASRAVHWGVAGRGCVAGGLGRAGHVAGWHLVIHQGRARLAAPGAVSGTAARHLARPVGWLHAGLSEAGLPAICIATRQAKAAMGAMPNKTDRNAARGIAQIVRTGWYRALHVKSPACRSWRALLTSRRMVLNKRRDVENGIRGLLREVGLKVGTPSRRNFPARVRDLTAGDPVLASLAESLLSVVEVMTREVEALTKRVLDEVKHEPTCRCLMTVPGGGPLTARAFRATIDQPGRFRTSRDVGAHLGLTPRRYQSGETDVQGRISRCGDELARTALYEAAHSLLIRSSKWSALRAWGMAVAKRRGMARARIAVARKLSVILHRMWADGTEFRSGSRPPHDTRGSSFHLSRAEPGRSRRADGRGNLVESPELARRNAARSWNRL